MEGCQAQGLHLLLSIFFHPAFADRARLKDHFLAAYLFFNVEFPTLLSSFRMYVSLLPFEPVILQKEWPMLRKSSLAVHQGPLYSPCVLIHFPALCRPVLYLKVYQAILFISKFSIEVADRFLATYVHDDH